ncbi:endonuclease-reverse transcriptase [Trichonephila clavipes]|nr:endonuclease-reverse transcriptase [Trichonephila clavipes]
MTASHEHHYPNFNELPPKEQQRLQKLFKQLDVTNDNKITAEDLAVAFKQMGIPYHPEGCIQALQRTSSHIRSNRLRWLGHIWRSPENNQTRAYTFKNPMGSRTRGRPPTRWIDDVENDLKTLNIKNWQSCCVSLELEEASCGGSQDL